MHCILCPQKIHTFSNSNLHDACRTVIVTLTLSCFGWQFHTFLTYSQSSLSNSLLLCCPACLLNIPVYRKPVQQTVTGTSVLVHYKIWRHGIRSRGLLRWVGNWALGQKYVEGVSKRSGTLRAVEALRESLEKTTSEPGLSRVPWRVWKLLRQSPPQVQGRENSKV